MAKARSLKDAAQAPKAKKSTLPTKPARNSVKKEVVTILAGIIIGFVGGLFTGRLIKF
jgi:hypothetical protein